MIVRMSVVKEIHKDNFWVSSSNFFFQKERDVENNVRIATECIHFDRKARSAAGKRALDKREPQVHEGTKQAVFMKTATTSEIVTMALKDLV